MLSQRISLIQAWNDFMAQRPIKKDERRADNTHVVMRSGNANALRGQPRLQARPKSEVEISVNVGIDFGTSSTKVFLRDLHHDKTYACLFDDNPDGYPAICMPSVVRVAHGRVYFGPEADRQSGGARLRSLKMFLRCANTCCLCAPCPNDLAAGKAGWLMLPGESDELVPADEVCAWFLAYVIRSVQTRCERVFASSKARLSYQMAAPLGMFENDMSRLTFERVLFLAERLSRTMSQGIALDELRSIYQGIAVSAVDLPSEMERVTFVQPETHAATIGYAASRRAVEGLYGIVDIGAGTTDISFFRLSRQGQRLVYYSTDTVPLGGDYVDKLILETLSASNRRESNLSAQAHANLLERVRIAEQDFCGEPIRLPFGFSLGPQAYGSASSELGKELFTNYRRIWGQAYEKEKRDRRWRDGFTLFLIGGGSELQPAVEPLSATPHKQFVDRVRIDSLELPDGIESDPPNQMNVVHEHAKLLMVAYGLSHHVAESPEFFLPKDVEPLSAPESVPVAVDDLYKDGQWW
jgi:hypothetical protein